MVKMTGVCRAGAAALALFAAVCASAADRVYLRWTANTNALKQTSCASVRISAEKGGAQRYLDLVCDSGSPATNALPVVRVIDAIAAGTVLQAVIGERPSDGESESYALVLADALERPVATAEPVTYEELPESAISVQTEFGLVTPAREDWNAGSPRPLERGFLVNGEDIASGSGTGWTYDGSVLSLTTAMTYVLSGAATNNEVQVHAAVSGATAVLSNAVVFASERPAVEVAQGAALTIAANQVMMTGETPEAMRYAETCTGKPCVLVIPFAPVTPGTPIGPFTTAEAATNAAKKAVINPRDDVVAKLGAGSTALGTYCNMFGFAVTGGDMDWFIEAVLCPEAWTNVILSAQEATRQIPVADIAALPPDTPTNVTAKACGVPGFFYSFYSGSTVTNLGAVAAEGGRNVLCGTDGDVEFEGVVKPSAAAGFFTVGAKEAPSVTPSDRLTVKLEPPAITDAKTAGD